MEINKTNYRMTVAGVQLVWIASALLAVFHPDYTVTSEFSNWFEEFVSILAVSAIAIFFVSTVGMYFLTWWSRHAFALYVGMSVAMDAMFTAGTPRTFGWSVLLSHLLWLLYGALLAMAYLVDVRDPPKRKL